MIVEFFCNLFFSMAHFLINLLPKFPSFSGLNVSMSPLFYVVRLLNMFVSFPVVSKCLLIVLVVYNLKFIWSFFMWLLRKIPGVS